MFIHISITQLRMLVMNACRALLSHQSLLRLVLLQQTAEISTSTNNLDAAADDTSQGSEVRQAVLLLLLLLLY